MLMRCIRSFVDQYSTTDSRSFEHAKSIARISACLSALEGILKGSSSFSPIRRYAISITVAACMDSEVLGRFANDIMTVEGHLNDLNEISSIEEILLKVCDCSFVYFHQDIFPVIFDYLFDTSLDSSSGSIHSVLSALSDPERMLKHVKHVDNASCLEVYRSLLLEYVWDKLVAPTCELVEFNLR